VFFYFANGRIAMSFDLPKQGAEVEFQARILCKLYFVVII
jgi:hypothetical protein